MDNEFGINSVKGRELFLRASGIVCDFCPGESQGLCEACTLHQVLSNLKPLPKQRMELVWHNCKTYPPSEDENDDLYLWVGSQLVHAKWDRGSWLCDGCYIDFNGEENLCWWADFKQTTAGFFGVDERTVS